jgi:protein ImuA
MSAALSPAAFVNPLLASAGVWRADQLAANAGAVLPSGHPALDAQLPGGGWPVGALTELLQLQSGAGEWGLVLPALAQLRPNASHRATLVLVGAPHVPLGPALQARGLDAQRLLWVRADTPAARSWACEQALRCADVAAVLAWLPQVRAEALRRLHLAAQDHAKLLWVIRPVQAQYESSPAPLRLLLESGAQELGARYESRVSILKRRGPPLERALPLCLHSVALQALLAAAHGRAEQRRANLASLPSTEHFTVRPELGLSVEASGHALDRFTTVV